MKRSEIYKILLKMIALLCRKRPFGVIGNTSDFGSEESRFETWWVNKTC
jgi:hypothetical protein